MSDVDRSAAVERFTDSITPILEYNAQGEITYPTDPEQLEKALKLAAAWDQFYATGDDSLLVEAGMFPAPEEEKAEELTSDQRRHHRMRTRRRASRKQLRRE